MFERTKDLKLSVIKQIEIEASKYPDSISLAQGIPDFDTPECIKRRVEIALKRGVVAKYSLSPGLPELRELIEISLANDNMFYDWQKEIIVTAGSIEGITATIMTITEPGDEIIIPEPTYTSYREVIILSGCKPIFVPLKEENNWSFELEEYEKAITPKTKAIFYCNPNNPTGTVYSKEQLIALAELAKKHDLFLISDEVYKDFIYNDKKIFSLAEIPELRKRVVRIFSFSKAYAMTGWRVAYLHSDESLVSEIIKIHDSLVTCAPVISQYGAMGALEMAEVDIKKFNIQYAKRRDYICDRLDKLKNIFSYVRPESSYYVFPKINPKIELKGVKKNNNLIDSWDFAMYLLKKAEVAVVPGYAFGPNGEGHIRFSFGRSIKDIKIAFDRLDKLFRGHIT
jgi:aminotransferase